MLYFVKKFNIRINNKLGPDFKLRILYTYPIMQKKFLVVVQVEDKVLLLGITDTNINLLTELDSNILSYVQENKITTPELNFKDLFKKFQK